MTGVRLIFTLPDDVDAERFCARVEARHRVAFDAPRVVTRTFLDTFDWRVFRAGGVLELLEGGASRVLRWRALDSGFVWHEREVAAAPRFARDLAPGRVRRRLERTIGVRALLPVARVRGTLRRARFLDEADKTVLGLELLEPLPGAGTGATRVALLPVRGYDHTDLAAALEREPGLAALERDPLVALTEDAARRPGVAPRGAMPALDPRLRADAACKRLLAALRDALADNEAGMAEDLDTEFLHDYRVAMRRTRSLLSQMREVFPEARVARFRREFRWLGTATGALRDLDVHLLAFDDYRALLPASIATDLGSLRAHLEARREIEQARLLAVLGSARYRRLRTDWDRFLAAPVPGRTGLPDAARPVVEVASERIHRAHRRTVRDGRAIGDDSPAEALHQLRKSCKKLRYLLEMFGSMFPGRDVARLVKRLKRLQENLGAYQDLQVQQRALAGFEAEMQTEGRLTAAGAHAIETLVAVLAERQAQARASFERRFADYVAKKVRGRFRAVFRAAAR